MMDRRIELAEETRGMAQGPMPARDFMNKFLPWNDTTPKKFRNLQPSAEAVKNLVAMAYGFRSPNLRIIFGPSISSLEKNAPDTRIVYFNGMTAMPLRISFCDSLSVDLNAVDIGKPTIRRTDTCKLDFANVETHTELKPKVGDDPYCDRDAASDGEEDDYEDVEQYASDPSADAVDEENDAPDEGCEVHPTEELLELDVAKDEDLKENMIAELAEDEEHADDTEPSPDEDYPFDNSTLCGQRTRGQISAYVGATVTLQFRTHLFTVVIFGSYARLLR
ncbi:hypothetical protein EDD18DRAFT_1464544 [Armillaria luteobubalina]|uniref:Uncharacterized protein n=1 Tax=Armillaria luteobubalina TaxID=153913 RepID=A0AA39UMC6_9AGAR|nr:hypothetical protein EDD18DRAFT_1464544 [Armillaria luteobubalina]